MDPIDLSGFSCPRCHKTVTADYYGPCQPCRDELRTLLAGEAKNVAAPSFEPKMNVTPNAVASKD